MPPINQQGSRAALVTTLVAFVILFVTSTIVAFHFYGLYKQLDLNYAAQASLYAPIVAANQTNGPSVGTLNATKAEEPGRFGILNTDPLIDIAVKLLAVLGPVVNGQNGTTPAQALKSIDDTIKASTSTLTGAQAPVSLTATNLTADINSLTAKIVDVQRQRIAATAATVSAQQDLAKAKAALVALGHQRDAQDAQIRAADAAQVAQLQKSAEDSNQKFADSEKAVTAAAADTKAQVDKALADVAAANGKIADLEKQRAAAVAALTLFRNDTANAIIQQVDGRIIRVPGNGVCYVDLGSSDHVTKGLTFEVYGAETGVPKIPPATTGDDQLPVGKASIEITDVGTTSSECRIVKTAPGAVLAEGDLLVNLIYDRNTKYKVFVYGNFDLAHTGRPNPADAEVIKRLVTQWGGELVDKVNVDTDFVVLGAEPQLPNFNKADMTPEESAKLQTAQDAIDKYQQIRTEATNSGVPVLNQNRFLYYVGYYDQARR